MTPFLGGGGGGGGGWTGSSSPICMCGAVIFAERMYDCMYDSLLISLCRKKSVMPFSNKCLMHSEIIKHLTSSSGSTLSYAKLGLKVSLE